MRAVLTLNIVDKDKISGTIDIWNIFKEIGLEPHSFINAISEGDNSYIEKNINVFKNQAENILKKIPNHSDEQKNKILEEKSSVIYFSHLTNSDSDFMVSKRSNGALRFRIHNSRLENLQNGCSELLTIFNKLNGKDKILEIDKKVELFEHDLDDSTIYGEIVKNRFDYLWKYESKDIIIAIGTLMFTLALTLIESKFTNFDSHTFQIVDRLMTGLSTTFLVSLLVLVYDYFKTVPLIKWTLNMKGKR